jgi:hypothetical protein
MILFLLYGEIYEGAEESDLWDVFAILEASIVV